MDLDEIIKEDGLEGLNRYYACYRGIVSDNEDPDFLGRLKVIVPSITGDEAIDTWAWPKGIFAGKDIGFFAVPNPKDGVWVSFENGDPRYPIWEYGWWAKNQVPSAANNNNGKPTNQVLQTTSGHRIEMDDKQGSEAIRITDKEANKIIMDKNGVIIEDKHGHQIVMKNGSWSVKSNDKVSLGTDGGSAEPALLGNKTEDVFNDIDSAIDALIIFATSASAATIEPALAPAASALNTSLAQAKASLVSHIALIKSQKVTLD